MSNPSLTPDIDKLLDEAYNQAIDHAIKIATFHRPGYEVVDNIIKQLQSLKKPPPNTEQQNKL